MSMKLCLEIEHDNPALAIKTLARLFKDTERSRVTLSTGKNHKRNINLLVVTIKTKDATSMRATVNSVLRLISMLENIK